jgi:predicted dehydrogenase
MFGGEIKTRPASSKEWTTVEHDTPYADANYRSLGVADLALAIVEGRPHRASGELALHVLEVMEAFEVASKESRSVDITHQCRASGAAVAVAGRWQDRQVDSLLRR